MHENNVAFLVRTTFDDMTDDRIIDEMSLQDIATANMVHSFEPMDQGLFAIPEGVIYFIDFGSTRLLPSGPGSGIHIYDWSDAGGHYDPPEGKDVVDPYAYDIYSLGHTLRELAVVSE